MGMVLTQVLSVVTLTVHDSSVGIISVVVVRRVVGAIPASVVIRGVGVAEEQVEGIAEVSIQKCKTFALT